MSEIFQPNNQEKLIPLNDSNDNLEINSLIQKISTTPFDISMNIDENIKYNETLNSKAIILGNSSVGKTSILFRLLKNRFPEKYELNEFKFDTIKFQIRINALNITSKIELNIIDIPSKNKYDEFMEKNSSSCEIFIFVYSIDDLESFEDIKFIFSSTVFNFENCSSFSANKSLSSAIRAFISGINSINPSGINTTP